MEKNNGKALIEKEIEKWATKLLELNAEKRKHWERREGLRKGTIQRQEAISGLVDDDLQAQARLKEMSQEAIEIEMKIVNLNEARKDCQRRLDEAKTKLAKFEYPEVQEQGKKLKTKLNKWLQEGSCLLEEIPLLASKSRDVGNLLGKPAPFDVVDIAFIGQRFSDIKEWSGKSVFPR